MVRLTDLCVGLITGGDLDMYLQAKGQAIENVGDALIEKGETSVLLNTYFDDEHGKYLPIFEFEDNGHITQFDNFGDAYQMFSEFHKEGADGRH
jgi:hypothetical protein